MQHSGANSAVVLIILDGFGVNPGKANNAIALAKTPNFDDYFANFPHTTLDASGHAVGLPKGQMGNSEVGHLTLGCGSIIRQDLVRIDDAIADGSFFENPVLLRAVEQAKARQRPLHLLGLLSDGGVHSHVQHVIALLDLCYRQGVKPMLHVISDGRDTAPQSAKKYLDAVMPAMQRAGGVFATLLGRFYAMDRDKRWARTQLAFQALVEQQGEPADDIMTAVDIAYARGETDEFIKPFVFPGAEAIAADDAVIFYNFRNDRPRQLTQALSAGAFEAFDRGAYRPVIITTMTEYDPSLALPVAFQPERPKTCLAEVISQAGLAQFHCAETEKYAHVTFFFNGGKEAAYPLEDRALIPSPKEVATYDLKPEMSAAAVAEATIAAIESGKYGFIVVNFANGDMVGHTAVPEAVIAAVETLDKEVTRVLKAAQAQGMPVLLTADHGNCEEMVDPITKQPHTQHTIYPVPCLLVSDQPKMFTTGGTLVDIAPTVLDLLNIAKPQEMTGSSLFL